VAGPVRLLGERPSADPPHTDPPTRFPDVAGQGNAESPGSDGASSYLLPAVLSRTRLLFLGERRPAPRRPADPFPLKSKVCQAGMIQWAGERSIPMKFAFGFFDWQIVNGGVPMMH
jgi:hypothetical protein